jgi:hypothetical protein
MHSFKTPSLLSLLLLATVLVSAQQKFSSSSSVGVFSLGTRNTLSLFSDDDAAGKGIGGQFRIQLAKRLNSEWFLDYITSRNASLTVRNDYHIGWSLLYYWQNHPGFDRLLEPYLIAGHCFDYSKLSEQNNRFNSADRLSMATQAGVGTHFNISPQFDCSLSGQYMVHFGKELTATTNGQEIVIEKKQYSGVHGHLLLTVSFNYKLFHLWKSKD